MKRRIAWLAVVSLAALSIVAAACSSPSAVTSPAGQTTTASTTTTTAPATTQTPATSSSAAKPQYGGSISLILPQDPSSANQWNLLALGKASPELLSHNYMWNGDWAKGPAGSNEIPWNESTNIPSYNAGMLATGITWAVNSANQTVTVTVNVRQGVHYALDSSSPASQYVAGREMTTADVLYCLNAFTNDKASMDYQLMPQDRGITAVQTGPWQVQITYPFNNFLEAFMRQLGLSIVFPPELRTKYGAAYNDWHNDVGTGPYMITDYVPDSMVSLKRNDNYWNTNPVGPGKGDQLPYIQDVNYYIIVDASTQDAALRTGKVDEFTGFSPDDAASMIKTAPQLEQAAGGLTGPWPAYMRTDLKPFNDVKVRQALMMATDFNTLNNSLYQGKGQILSWPTTYNKAYAGLYLGLNDPEMPADVKALYEYNPDQAKQLLAQAGYPNGFDTSIILPSTPTSIVDYYSAVKAQWAKVGVNLSLDQVQSGNIINIASGHTYKQMFALFYAPDSTWPEQANYTNPADWVDASMVDDPYVNQQADKARVAAVTDFNGAMSITKDLMKYVLLQAYCIPTPQYPQTTFWWPWVKNYAGEIAVGYFPADNWVQWVWIDQALKKSMGH